MSYARWSSSSDVYVFINTRGYYECCACRLAHIDPLEAHSFEFERADDMVKHLQAHRAEGHKVRDDTLEALQKEASP